MSEKNGVPYNESELYRIRHSAAHVMAEAVLTRFPDAKLAIGPPIEDGFYYDFDLGQDEYGKPITFSPEDLEQIEHEMKRLLKKNARFEKSSMSIEEAQSFALTISLNQKAETYFILRKSSGSLEWPKSSDGGVVRPELFEQVTGTLQVEVVAGARSQLNKYASDPRVAAAAGHCTIKKGLIVFNGWEMVHCEEY